MSNKKRLIILAAAFGVLAAAAAILFLIYNFQDKNEKKETIVIGVKGDILGFAPKIISFDERTMGVNSNIFDPLVALDDDYKIVPGLAESWSNLDRNTWRLYLRKGVKFHNGDSFSSADVKFTIEYLLQDKNNIFKGLLRSIDRVEITDDYTVDIITKEPDPTLLNKLIDVYILPHRYKEIVATDWPIGTGAYKLNEYVEGDRLVLERNNGYWKDLPAVKTATYIIIADDEARGASLFDGNIDLAESITNEQYKQLEGSRDFSSLISVGKTIMYLSFDFRKDNSFGFSGKSNPVADPKVRKAIYYAIDEAKLMERLAPLSADTASQFVSPEIFGYSSEIKRPLYNLDEAKELMKEAGYGEGFDIQLDCPRGQYANDEKICLEIAKQLRALNIEVTVKIAERQDFFQKIISKHSSFYLFGWASETIDGGEIFDYLLSTPDGDGFSGLYNAGYYSNPEVDRLGAVSRQEANPLIRLQSIQQGFREAMYDTAWIPLYSESNLYGLTNAIIWPKASSRRIILKDISFK